MTTDEAPRRCERRARRRPAIHLVVLALTVTAASACQDDGDATTADDDIEFRDGTGPHVDVPEQSMAMTVDALDVDGDDILVRVRVENRDEGYLDLGVQDTIYGPLLVMTDDRDHRYDGYANEPAGIPGRRLADLSFRLAGPLDVDAETFTLELATQRGPLVTPPAALPDAPGVRWRVDDPVDGAPAPIENDDGEPGFAAAPRLPELVHFWLHTEPLPAER